MYLQTRCTTWSAQQLDRAKSLLSAARRPVAIFGWEAAREPGIEGPARRFVESWRLPFMTLPKSKGVVPEDHALFLGTLEMAGTDHLFAALQDCDVVVMVGVDAVEFDRFWDFPCEVLSLASSSRIDGYHPIHIGLLGHLGQALLELSRQPEPGKWLEESIGALHFRPVVDTESSAQLSRQRAIKILRELLPRETILTSDTGTNKSITGQVWRAYLPLSYLVSNGLSTMGYALPSAIGAKMVFPDRPVLAVMGDGGFLMTLGELATAVRQKVAITAVVFVDRALDAIRKIQVKRGLPVHGTEFELGDITVVASAFGWNALLVRSEADLRAVAADLSSVTCPTLVQVDLQRTARDADRDLNPEESETLTLAVGLESPATCNADDL